MGWIGLVGSAKLPADVLAGSGRRGRGQRARRAEAAGQLGEPDLSVDTPAIQREDTAVSNNAAIVQYGIKSF